jgi:hypothetical protein
VLPTTKTEIRELRNLVIGLREEMRVGFASADNKLVELKAEMNLGFANVDTKFAELSGNVKEIDQKLASLDDRVKNQDGKLWTLVTIILGAASTLLIKILGFPNSP